MECGVDPAGHFAVIKRGVLETLLGTLYGKQPVD
jgi:hypothetical protein